MRIEYKDYTISIDDDSWAIEYIETDTNNFEDILNLNDKK